MIRKISILSFLFLINLFSQSLPESYKISDTPSIKTADASGNSLLSNSITDILIVGDTIWLGTSRGLSRSTDDGNTWENFYGDDNFGSEGIVSLAYANNKIWVSLGHTEKINGADIQTGGGLRFSSDNGNTWNKIAQPVDDPGDSLITYGINTIRALPVVVEQQNISFGLSAFGNTVWIASWAGGIRKSTDFGATWHRIILPPDFLDSISPTDTLNFSLQGAAGKFGPEQYLNHLAFSVLAINDTLIYAGTAGGINRSIDGGISWQKFNYSNTNGAVPGNWNTNLTYNEYNNSVWAACWKAEGENEYFGATVTSDNGKTWQPLLAGEKIYGFTFKNYIDANSASATDIITVSDNGVFRTTDGGTTWISPGRIIDNTLNLEVLTNTFYSAGIKKSSGKYIIWLGSAGDGLVKFTETQSPWQGEWRILLSSEKIAAQNETYAFPNPFAPDQENVRIKYFTSISTKVTIRLFDFGMNLIKTLIQNVERTGPAEHYEYWNGRAENGDLVANGVYFYRIDFDSGEPVFGKIMSLR